MLGAILETVFCGRLRGSDIDVAIVPIYMPKLCVLSQSCDFCLIRAGVAFLDVRAKRSSTSLRRVGFS